MQLLESGNEKVAYSNEENLLGNVHAEVSFTLLKLGPDTVSDNQPLISRDLGTHDNGTILNCSHHAENSYNGKGAHLLVYTLYTCMYMYLQHKHHCRKLMQFVNNQYFLIQL